MSFYEAELLRHPPVMVSLPRSNESSQLDCHIEGVKERKKHDILKTIRSEI